MKLNIKKKPIFAYKQTHTSFAFIMSRFEEKIFEITIMQSKSGAYSEEYDLVFASYTYSMYVHIYYRPRFIYIKPHKDTITPQCDFYYRIVFEALKNNDDDRVEKTDEKDSRVYAVHYGKTIENSIELYDNSLNVDYLCNAANGYALVHASGTQREFAYMYARVRMTMAIDPDMPIEPDFEYPLK